VRSFFGIWDSGDPCYRSGEAVTPRTEAIRSVILPVAASAGFPTCFDRLSFQLSLPLCQLDHNLYQVFLFVRTKVCVLVLVDWFKQAGIIQLVNAFLE